jgi:hypothetical protein
MQRDDETERNDKQKQGQEDARGEAAGNATTRNNALLHYNQSQTKWAQREAKTQQSDDKIRDNTIRDNTTRQIATMQHNVARRRDDETTRQQTKQDGEGTRGETRVGRREWGERSGERGEL